jgi:3-dehydroquinate dehydratase/shikimate dehydrogenase
MLKPSSSICAVITQETLEAARAALLDAARCADLAEVRLDYLRDFDFSDPGLLRPLLEGRPLPVILTCRAFSEGGRQMVDEPARLRLLVEGAKAGADYCDIEYASIREALRFAPDPSRLIVSHHNFDQTPADIQRVYEELRAVDAAVLKIAVQANRISDTLAIFKLLDRAQSEGRNLIALGMGQSGLITRALGPSRGSFLTYGSLGRGRESASGQPTCEELKKLYRVHAISRETLVTGIIGNTVAHSASPAMHNAAFEDAGIDCVYLPFEVEDAAEFFKRFVRRETREIEWNLRGLSVTIPHKVEALDLVDEIDERGRKAGAINTVVIDGGHLRGHNTDVAGAMEPLEKVCNLRGEICAVLGAGGAARAVAQGLVERGAKVSVFARRVERAQQMARSFGVEVFPMERFESHDAPVVINTTPVGMSGHSEGVSPVPRRWLAGRRIAYDLVYNPLETAFLRDARAEGCRIIDGLEMLVSQAALQFELWTGSKAPADVMRKAALEKVKRDTDLLDTR